MRSALVFCRHRKLVCAAGGGDAATSIAVFGVLPFAMEAHTLRARQRVSMPPAYYSPPLVAAERLSVR
jgi:hypothetical protein